MSMTQRYAGMLRRNAGELDKLELPVQAECLRQAARHMEELQAKVDEIACPWHHMNTAPKDGTAVLALLEGADVAHAVRWLPSYDKFAAGTAGWHMVWDLTRVAPHDGPRYWMPCPGDPDSE
jgi:hypothetical protein